jgi:hypothetical protein
LFAACAQPDYDADKLQDQLRDAGVPAEEARCVTDELTEAFDPAQLASRSDPTDEERVTTRRILRQCGVTTTTRPPSTPTS